MDDRPCTCCIILSFSVSSDRNVAFLFHGILLFSVVLVHVYVLRVHTVVVSLPVLSTTVHSLFAPLIDDGDDDGFS